MQKQTQTRTKTEKIVEALLKKLEQNTHCTFVELTEACGADALGDHELALDVRRPNTILWSGLSEEFGAAFSALAPRLALDAASLSMYAFDGQTLSLPIPSAEEYEKSIATKADFDEPRWLPVTVSLRSERRKDAKIRELHKVSN